MSCNENDKTNDVLMRGVKYDQLKPDWRLLPLPMLREVLRVLMHGAKKYSPDNWKQVGGKDRYLSAALRHICAHQDGEILDRESGLTHISHAICCLLFTQWQIENRVCVPRAFDGAVEP